MPTVHDIEQALYALAPRDLAMEWDNVGHLLGDPDRDVKSVLVALDVTEAVADEAIEKGCDLIVAHHPLINCKWEPVQTIRSDDPKGRLLLRLLRGGVDAICMHTNLDCADGGVNDLLAERLELESVAPLGDEEGLCRMGTVKAPMTMPEFAAFVCRALGCNGVRYSDAGKTVRKVAVGGGACGEFESAAIAAGCDTFVTADLKYHQFLDAEGKGINLMDAGHFPTEDPVCGKLVSYLTAQFPELSVTKSTSHKEVIQYYIEGEK